jgi:uncharacterized circularly permuted ATP-grasp superfamily protein
MPFFHDSFPRCVGVPGLVAKRRTGTLGVLVEAAGEGLLDLTAAFAALRGTNFRNSPAMLDTLLAEHRARREMR